MCSNNNQLGKKKFQNCSITVYCNVMFCNYPSISSLFKHLGMYVCINLYHCPHLAAVMVPMFLCRAWSSNWVRKLPNAIPCRLASALLFICSCCSGRLMSAFMAAFKVLIACSTMLRKELYGGSFLSSEFDQKWQDCSELVCRHKWKSYVHLGRGLALPVTENH